MKIVSQERSYICFGSHATENAHLLKPWLFALYQKEFTVYNYQNLPNIIIHYPVILQLNELYRYSYIILETFDRMLRTDKRTMMVLYRLPEY